MVVEIVRCEVAGNHTILSDLARFRSVDEWLDAILHMDTAFRPVQCNVIWGGVSHVFVQNGRYAKASKTWLKELRGRSGRFRSISSDKLYVYVDVFQYVLYLNLDGK